MNGRAEAGKRQLYNKTQFTLSHGQQYIIQVVVNIKHLMTGL